MKKNFSKVLAFAAAGTLALAAVAPVVASATPVKADVSSEEYRVFVAFGGDAAEENDWGLSYAGGDASEGITVTDGTITSGGTTTVSLEFANPVVNAWYFAPTMIAEDVTAASFDVQVLIDGEEVAVDMSAGDNWWYEGTGDFTQEQAIRIAGGFNEWGAQYIAEPAGFTKLEFVITAGDIEVGAAPVGELVEATDEYETFIAFGGDAAEENDWAYNYAGGEAPEGITVTNGTITSGGTTTVSIEFANPVVNAWYFAPVIIAEGVAEADFSVECAIDGNPVDIDMAAGDNWWYEGTGDYTNEQSIRVAGGFNEWGAQYIAEPAGFTKLEYTITANKIMLGTPAEEELISAPIDLDGVYHAYIGFQTPTYSFRNAWSDGAYGFGTPEFDQVTGWDADNNEIVRGGSFTDVEIAGNGTYTVSVNGLECPDDFSAQDYMNLIFVSTDIPYTTDVTFSDVKLNVNGSEQSISNFVVPDTDAYLQAQIQNIWDTDNGIAEIGYYPTPVTDMSITFTVSGFNYDNTAAVVEEVVEEDTTEDVATEEEPVVAEPAQAGLPVGAIVGIVIGCVVIVAGVVVAIILVNKKKKANK